MKRKKSKFFKWVIWFNLLIGMYNLYFYVSDDRIFNLVIGILNVGVWVFNRRIK